MIAMNAHLTTLICTTCATQRAGHENEHTTHAGPQANAYCKTCRKVTLHDNATRAEKVEEIEFVGRS